MGKNAGNHRRRGTAGRELEDDIVRKITEGQWLPGTALPSTAELASRYGISLVTAHKSLQHLVDDNYLIRHSGRGTFVADFPLPSRDGIPIRRRLGLPVYMQANPIHLRLIEEISNQAPDFGFDLKLGQGEAEVAFIDKLASENIHFMIRSPLELLDEHLAVDRIRHHGIKAVMINNFWFRTDGFPMVRSNTEQALETAMAKLLELGHRRILFVDESFVSPRLKEQAAYFAALVGRGIAYDESLVRRLTPKISREEVASFFDDIIASGSAAVFTYDLYAVAFMKHLKQRGLEPGRDFSVVGIDDIPQAEPLGLSSIRHPMVRLVKTAYEILLTPSEYYPREIILDAEFIPRASLRPCPGNASRG